MSLEADSSAQQKIDRVISLAKNLVGIKKHAKN